MKISEGTLEKLEAKNSLIETKDTNKVIKIFVFFAVSLLICSVANFSLVFLAIKLSAKEKIFVLEQDKIQIAQEKDPNFRSNQVIRDTVIDWLHLTWEWEPSIDGQSTPDLGVTVKSAEGLSFTVPSRVYLGSYLLEIGFREKFLEQLSRIIPRSFYSGKLSSNLKIYYTSTPQRIDEYHYKIDVILTRTDIGEYNEIGEAKIDRTIYLRTMHPYELILDEDEPSPLRKKLHELLKNGLLISKIEPLKK